LKYKNIKSIIQNRTIYNRFFDAAIIFFLMRSWLWKTIPGNTVKLCCPWILRITAQTHRGNVMPLISYGPRANYYRNFNPFTLNVLLLAFKAIAFNAREMNETVRLGITTVDRVFRSRQCRWKVLSAKAPAIASATTTYVITRVVVHFQQPDSKILYYNHYSRINANRVIYFYFSF